MKTAEETAAVAQELLTAMARPRVKLKQSTRELIRQFGEDRYLMRKTEIFKRDVLAKLLRAARASGARRAVNLEEGTELE